MSKQQNSTTITASRYRLFLREQTTLSKKRGISGNLFALFGWMEAVCRRMWVKVVPSVFRGQMNQLELLITQLNDEEKSRFLPLFSSSSIETCLSSTINKSPVFAFVYSNNDYKICLEFLIKNHSFLDQYKICPLRIDSCEYILDYKQKIGEKTPRLLMLWRGFFDEIQIIEEFSLQDVNINKRISQSVALKRQFQAEVERKLHFESSEEPSSNKLIGGVDGHNK